MGSEQQPFCRMKPPSVVRGSTFFFIAPKRVHPGNFSGPKKTPGVCCGFFFCGKQCRGFFVFGAILIFQPIVEIVAEHIETAECTATCVHITRTEFVRNIRFVKDLEKNNEGRTMYRKFLGTSIEWIEFCLTVGK